MPKKHDAGTRAAVMAALLSGQGVSEVAEAYQVPASTVSRWKKRARALLDDVEADAPEIGPLLVRYVQVALATIIEQQEAFADRAWLREQDASELAVLHGVTVDKLVRLLEAMDGSPVQPEPTGNGHRNRVRGHV